MSSRGASVLLLACCVSSIQVGAAEPARTPAPPIVGTWCPMSEHSLHAWGQTKHTMAEAMAMQRLWRRRESVRLTFGLDGSVEVDGKRGTWTVDAHEGALWGLRLAWAGGDAPEILPVAEVVVSPQEGWSGVMIFWSSDDWIMFAPEAHEGCFQSETASLTDPAAPYSPPPATDLEREPWIGQPPARWPQLVLTNDARFRGSSPLQGASGFLVEHGGRVLGATAEHLIGPAGGVEPRVPLSALDQRRVSWRMHPRTRPSEAVQLGDLAMAADERAAKLDWLVAEITPKKRLPAEPLRLRTTRVELNERVYLVGCQYVDRDCVQRVWPGRVTGRKSGPIFRYQLDTPVQIAGFSGAPVLDANGHVVGVMSVAFSTYVVGRDYLEAGGFDASALVPLLKPTPE